MARVTKPLTDTQIKNTKFIDKNLKLFDGNGLFILISKTSKLWRLKYRFDGKERLMALGEYPVITLSKARDKATEAKRTLAEGINPLEKKEAVTTRERTFKTVATEYFDKDDKLSENYKKRILQGFRVDVYPHIGSMNITEIEASDIGSIILPMQERGALESARKIFHSVNKIFKSTLSRDMIDKKIINKLTKNPCADIVISDILGEKSTNNHPVITDDAGLSALLNNIDSYTGNFSTVQALKILPYIFLRSASLRHMKWSWINFDNKQMIVPAEHMKMKQELIVPLSDTVVKILQDTQLINQDSEYCFPSPMSVNSPLSSQTLLGALRRLGYTTDDIVPHSFRAIFSTLTHEHSIFEPQVIETQLAHSVGNAVSKAYNRALYLPQRVELMNWWSDYLANIKKV